MAREGREKGRFMNTEGRGEAGKVEPGPGEIWNEDERNDRGGREKETGEESVFSPSPKSTIKTIHGNHQLRSSAL